MTDKKLKHSALKQTYYRSFALLVVIPLVLVFIAAELVIGYILRNSAIETIDAVQENIAETLNSDIKTASIQLSHFVYSNDGEFLRTAVSVHNSSGSEWYNAEQLLQKGFNTAVVPSQNILAGGFYMKDGGAVYVKEDIIIPREDVRGSDWYISASDKPNTIVLGCYDTGRSRLTSSIHRKSRLVLVTAMSTNFTTDKSGEIEVVAFLTESRVSDIISAQSEDKNQGVSVILDKNGHVLFGDTGSTDGEKIRSYFEENLNEFGNGSKTAKADFYGVEKPFFFKTKAIPDTDWNIVTFVEESRLGQRFYLAGGIVLLIVFVLLMLFYMYSHYFLNAIITPIQTVCEAMSRLDNSDLEVQVEPTGDREIRELMTSFNQMVLGIKNMFHMTEESSRKKHEAEMQALQRQINPHFIVNTLNSIRFMAEVAKFDGIRRMAESLVSIVSCSFRSNAGFYTVRDELEMLKTYVYIMRIRYSNGFDVEYDIAEDCLDYRIPRLTLQPVVENSITHGLDEFSEDLGQVKVSAYTKGDFLCLEVWDNGRGMSGEQIKSLLDGSLKRSDNSGIGVENVIERLKLHFGEASQIFIESELGKFTRTVLRIPLSACRKGESE